MKISIIIPVYNGEQFIADCIQSALDQDLDLFEVICINDGSIDDTQDILANLERQHSVLKVINKINEGPAKAREVGVKSATGEYLVFLDGDDLFAPNSLGQIYSTAKEHALDMGIYRFVSFSSEPRFADSICHNLELVNIYSGEEYINQFMYTAYNWDKLWRREFYINNVLSGVGGFYYEDQLPILKGIYYSSRIANLDIECVGYRDNANSITRRAITKEHYIDLQSVILDYATFIQDNNLYHSRCVLMKLAHMLALLDSHRNHLHLEFTSDILLIFNKFRVNIISKNNGVINLYRKVGFIYTLYFKLKTPYISLVYDFIRKAGNTKLLFSEKLFWLKKSKARLWK